MLYLHQCEATIQGILDDYNDQPTGALKHKVLFEWRGKLAKEPASMPLHHIDQIIREVRRRIGNAGW